MPALVHSSQQHRAILRRIARAAMAARGLRVDFSAESHDELQHLAAPDPQGTPVAPRSAVRDLTALPWASIDNDDSRDLDQLTVADDATGDAITIRVAVADVDVLVADGSAIDLDARVNTTSVYTAGEVFAMLPERLSTDLTSLNPGQTRLAVVVEMTIAHDGTVGTPSIYRAWVRNHAQLTYDGVAAWLEQRAPAPAALAAVPALAENLRRQDAAAQRLRQLRRLQGALSLDTIRARPIFEGETIQRLDAERASRATAIIEDFMIAANGATARFLATSHSPSIRRVVRTPRRWDRIVALAAERGTHLPDVPDAVALEAFLVAARAADPDRFADVSLSVIKLLGSGEYVAQQAGATAPGHFGLAVKDYTHSTAPNRRYPDLVTQRLLKAALAGRPTPYTFEELDTLARHMTAAEDAATKVERQVGKSAAALLLESRVGDRFEGFVTGASDKGTWARLRAIPVEGRIVQAYDGLDVGDEVRVQLLSVDVERGFIDFRRV